MCFFRSRSCSRSLSLASTLSLSSRDIETSPCGRALRRTLRAKRIKPQHARCSDRYRHSSPRLHFSRVAVSLSLALQSSCRLTHRNKRTHTRRDARTLQHARCGYLHASPRHFQRPSATQKQHLRLVCAEAYFVSAQFICTHTPPPPFCFLPFFFFPSSFLSMAIDQRD